MDDDAQVRQAAHQSLDRIDPNWTASDGAKAARPRLESMLTNCEQSDVERLRQLLDSAVSEKFPRHFKNMRSKSPAFVILGSI